MPPYLGDFDDDQTVHFIWSSNGADGASITRATNGVVRVYKDNGVAQTTAGVTDTEDFDALIGIHSCTIVTTNIFYVNGSNYTVVLSAATIDGVTVNAVLAHFSILNRASLRPTTAGRTLDIAATGEVALDFGSTIGTIDAAQIGSSAITAAKIATSAITSAKFSAGAINAAAIATDAITAAKIATNAITDDKINAGAITAVKIATDAITATKIATDSITAAKIATDAIGASELAIDAVNEIRDSILSDATKFAGANINATISSRATPAQVNTEVLDVMQTDTFAQVGQEAPAATQSFLKMLQFLYKAWRNKTDQTATDIQLYNDDTSTVDQQTTVSDDATTFTRNEMASGP